MSRPTFQGIVPPMVTPLDDQREVDLDGLGCLAERLIAGGVDGIFALGTTGEGPSLSMVTRQQVVSAVCDQVAGRVPVFVGITDTIRDASIELAEMSYAAGAVAVVLAPPYYLPMTQDELLTYTYRLADRSPLPIMLYNMPGCCKTWFQPETVRQLGDHERIVGLKDSSGDLDYFRKVVGLFADDPQFSFFVGPEEILVDAMRLGCHGGVHGGANLFPRLYVAMQRAAARQEWAEAERLQRLVLKISESLYQVGDGASRIIKGIKSGLSHVGVCGNEMAEPFVAHTEAESRIIGRHVDVLVETLGELSEVSS